MKRITFNNPIFYKEIIKRIYKNFTYFNRFHIKNFFKKVVKRI